MKTNFRSRAGLLFLTGIAALLFCNRQAQAAAKQNDDSLRLRKAVDRFIQCVDSAKVSEVINFYDGDFESIRVVDQGPLIKMNRQQMVYFWEMQTAKNPSTYTGFNYQGIVTQKTTINYIEISGETAYVLLTRIKDLGSGPEPMF